MKKVLVLLLTLTLSLALSLSAFAASDKSNNGKGKGADKAKTKATATDKALMKQFKKEMNQAIKGLATLETDRSTLAASLEELKANPLTLETATEEEIADYNAAVKALEDQIAKIDGMLANPEAAKKQLINERFMVIKSVKSGFVLSEYDNAEALIAAMYTAAEDPEAWSIWTNKSENLLKLEGPLYLKGGKIMFPLAALRELGAEVTWDATAKTVTVVGANGMSVIFSPEGKAATAQASVADSAIVFMDGAVAEEKIGTVTGTLTDPVTGKVYNVEASITMTFALDEITGEIIDESLGTSTVTADIVDPETGEIIKTIDGELSGSLTEPLLTFNEAAMDIQLSNTIYNCGRAYHPLNELAELFGLEVVADVDEGVLEVAPETVDEGVQQ